MIFKFPGCDLFLYQQFCANLELDEGAEGLFSEGDVPKDAADNVWPDELHRLVLRDHLQSLVRNVQHVDFVAQLAHLFNFNY